MRHSVIHSDAESFFRSFRYDAHPMSMLTSAFSMLGSYYPEANPSLQGMVAFLRDCVADAHCRPTPVYERRLGLARQYGSADLQVNWESDNACCVSFENK